MVEISDESFNAAISGGGILPLFLVGRKVFPDFPEPRPRLNKCLRCCSNLG